MEHVDLPSVTQKSSLLEIYSIYPTKTLAVSVEHTPIVASIVEASIAEVSGVMFKFFGNSSAQ